MRPVRSHIGRTSRRFGWRAVALSEHVGDVGVDFLVDPMIAIANLHRLGKLASAYQPPDVRVGKFDALGFKAIEVQ